jgi:DNA-binding transcriptional LysR family regulator
MTLSLGKLQQIITVARYGSFSRAAEELNISQPALSRSIAAIELRYGFQIFNRIGHGVHPTAAGAQVIAQAEPLLQSMRVFDSNLRLLASGTAGTLKMGLPPLLASQLLAQLASDFFAPHSQAELRVSVRSGPALLEELKNDAIELFFFADTQIEPCPEIEIQAVGTIRPACIVRSGHPLAARPNPTIDDLSQFPWACSVEPPAMGKHLNRARFLCDNYHVLREAVLKTDLVCICTQAFVAEDIAKGSLQEIAVANFLPPETPIHMAILRGRVMSPLAAAALGRIKAHLRRPPNAFRAATAIAASIDR